MQINLEPFVDQVYRFALSLTRDRESAEDLTQACLLKACQNQSQLVDEKAIRAWLFQILVNLRKDQFKKKHLITDSATDVDTLSHAAPTPTQIAIQNESQANIISMMQELPERQRTVLHLSAVEQMNIKEIATMLGSTDNAVKANLSIARKTLRKKLAQSERAEPTRSTR